MPTILETEDALSYTFKVFTLQIRLLRNKNQDITYSIRKSVSKINVSPYKHHVKRIIYNVLINNYTVAKVINIDDN